MKWVLATEISSKKGRLIAKFGGSDFIGYGKFAKQAGNNYFDFESDPPGRVPENEFDELFILIEP